MRKHKLRDDGEKKYFFSHDMREAIFKEWKEEFHADPFQRRLQEEDRRKNHATGSTSAASHLGASSGRGRTSSSHRRAFRPNNAAVRKGKHARFHRHLQRVGGSKQMVEVILFTGRADMELLRKVAHRGAPQPAELLAKRPDNGRLKRAAHLAKKTLREGNDLARQVRAGKVDESRLTKGRREMLKNHASGKLQRDANAAIAAYGHGTMRSEDGRCSLTLGGSTGGRTRAILDNWKPIPDEEIQRFKRQRDHRRDDGVELYRYKRPRLT